MRRRRASKSVSRRSRRASGQVLTHVVEGRLNKQIAGDLGTVEKTIKVHRARMMEKMKVRSVAELVRLMERAGIRPTRRPSSAKTTQLLRPPQHWTCLVLEPDTWTKVQ